MNSNRQSNPPFHSLELSEAAQGRVLEHVHNFARVLIGQAKASAYYENLDIGGAALSAYGLAMRRF